MPSFPRYESKGQLTSQAPSVGAPQDTSAQMIEATGKIGAQVQDAALKWSNAVDTIQKTTATANFKSGMLDITNRAQNDPDYNNSDQYFKEIEKLKTDNLKGFSSKQAEGEMAINFGYESKVGQIQIQNLYKKKMIDVGQASTLKLIDTEVNNPNDASLQNIQKVLNTQVNAGLIDHKDAYALLEKANKELGINRISKDLYQAQTPEQIDQVTQALASGGYEKGGVTIDPEKKKSLFEVADRAKQNLEKKIKAQQEDALVQNRMETITGVASGKIPLDSINMSDVASYDPQLATTLTKVKDFMVNYNPKLQPKEQPMSSAGLMSTQHVMQMKSYAKTITDVFLQDDNKQLSDFVLRELEKKGDGLTSSVKLAAFTNLAALKAKVNNQQTQPDLASADRFSAIKAGLKFLQASNPYLFPQTVADFVVKNFLTGSSSHQTVMQEAKSVLKDKLIEKYPKAAKLPSMPNKIVDGEASVEDLQAGENDLKDGQNGSYADAPSD